jgi:hypothetical protein
VGQTNPNGGNGKQSNPNGGNGKQSNPNGGNGKQPNPNGGNGKQPNPNGGNGKQPNPNGGNGKQPNPNGGNGKQSNPNGGNGGQSNQDALNQSAISEFSDRPRPHTVGQTGCQERARAQSNICGEALAQTSPASSCHFGVAWGTWGSKGPDLPPTPTANVYSFFLLSSTFAENPPPQV